jgi:hypothetical protein
MAAISKPKATGLTDDRNHREDLRHPFHDRNRHKDKRFYAVLTCMEGAEEIDELCVIRTDKKCEMKTSESDNALDELAMSG